MSDGFQDTFEILLGNLRPAIIVEHPLSLIPYADPTQNILKVAFELNLPLLQVVPFLEKNNSFHSLWFFLLT